MEGASPGVAVFPSGFYPWIPMSVAKPCYFALLGPASGLGCIQARGRQALSGSTSGRLALPVSVPFFRGLLMLMFLEKVRVLLKML
ncbi:MAG: hypothetical protein AVDCRST_MAG25-1750 [uncultured Rubrobacteraceae bacterium]|uniref:Uncharacterized protein n=1 Tax=uncultured Rubrobacteraceae bacterium TaxID=349277 RepID=A0A6J4R9H4_9ACTN|nr:MAG: hypothetical protein AVDCRST_MAG25-1750 [uncultured Rubrobacteraceae bacterium]